MKRYLRLCLILLISLTLPLTGMAGVQSPTQPCPMITPGAAMTSDMGMDCCNDVDMPGDHGKPCKPGLECKSGGVLQMSCTEPPVNPLTAVTLIPANDHAPTRTSHGVWRPPRV